MFNQFTIEKLPALWEVVALFLGGGALAFLAGRMRWWTGVVSIPAFQVMGMSVLAVLQHPMYGGVIRAERGAEYVVVTFLAVMLGGAVLPAWGAVLGWNRAAISNKQ